MLVPSLPSCSQRYRQNPEMGERQKSAEPLPVLPLALSVHQAIPIDLDETSARAAKRAYLA
jgi:hypothetical protein